MTATSAATDRVAADLGYRTIAMRSATIGDHKVINEQTLIANATKSFQPQQIVLSHANLPPVTRCYSQLLGIIASRKLKTVTLNDVFG